MQVFGFSDFFIVTCVFASQKTQHTNNLEDFGSILPAPWPLSFDAVYTLGDEKWQRIKNITDLQNVSYDWPSRRMTVLHTDMYGCGPGRDWNIPSGAIVFQSANHSKPCCTMFPSSEHGGQVPPDWTRHDNVTYLGTELVYSYADKKMVNASKWSQPGYASLNFYWQDPADRLPLQWGTTQVH